MVNQKNLQDSSMRIKQLPDYVQEAMVSPENAQINTEISKKYGLKEEEIPLMVNVIARTILKEISLTDFPSALKEKLKISEETTKAMALDIATKRFFPLREHLKGIEDLIKRLGGEAPKEIPKTPFRPSVPPTPSVPSPKIIRKDLLSALKENKNLENQLISSQPIKIEGLEGLVKPTIKNWLSDYIRLKGIGSHSYLVRSDYIYNSPNARILNEKEREILGKILQSYDENTSLPILSETGLLLLEEIKRESDRSQIPKSTLHQSSPPPARPFMPGPTPPPRPSAPSGFPPPKISPGQEDIYREPIPEEPEKPEPPKPTPRLNGNIIDLKDFGENR